MVVWYGEEIWHFISSTQRYFSPWTAGDFFLCVCVCQTCDRISLTYSVCKARFLWSHTLNGFSAKHDAMPKNKETPFEAQILERLDQLQVIPGDIKQLKGDIGTILKMNEEYKQSLDLAHTCLDEHAASLKEKDREISALKKDFFCLPVSAVLLTCKKTFLPEFLARIFFKRDIQHKPWMKYIDTVA